MAQKTKNAGSGAKRSVEQQILDRFDATKVVGLRVYVENAAVQEKDATGEITVEIPQLKGLLASAAVSRCLMPIRLRGHEIRAIRKIAGLTLAKLAERMDTKAAPETISRWETGSQPIGGYAEKVLRLLICEALHGDAQGVSYDASIIANLRVLDPWITNKNYEVPYLEFQLVKMKERESGSVVDAWDRLARVSQHR